MVRGGAEHVTAARWTLPTDAAFAAAALRRGTGEAAAFSAAVAAVDAAHEAPDPVAALGAWQRDQAERWAATASPAYSPLLWAAFATTWAPGSRAGLRLRA